MPRGARARANAFARGADYVAATMRRLALGGDSNEMARAARAADAALHRLDDVFRQYLAERSVTRINVEDVAALVGGAQTPFSLDELEEAVTAAIDRRAG